MGLRQARLTTRASAAPTEPEPLAARTARLAVVGISVKRTCGVRDHAALLAQELEREGVPCEFHWLLRSESSLRSSRADVHAWVDELSRALDSSRADAILLHYSVFSYAYKGVPLFVRPLLRALRAAGLPVISVLHELAFPWRYDGLRGSVWALSQRTVLRDVISTSTAVLVTADFRAEWLASRRWLPRRPVTVAPVFSALPAPHASCARPAARGRGADRQPQDAQQPGGQERGSVIGVFGYAYQGAAVSLVLDAVRELRAGGADVHLRLLGAPGRSSTAGEQWSAAAAERGLAAAVSFSGELPAQTLSDELAACEVIVFADASGPSSRKTTLAASLASGVAVVALDGRRKWAQLVSCEAARIVAPTVQALTDAIAELLRDEPMRRELGTRGRAFAETEMTVARTAAAVKELLDGSRGRGGS